MARKPVYLNIIWHQHQPLYLDPSKDQLMAPWVRTHATKDYYSMAATLLDYPRIHCTVNLTSVLLMQLQTYYIERLVPFVDFTQNRIRAREFLVAWKEKTDPWIDLMLQPAETFSDEEKARLISGSWSALSVSGVTLDRFPEFRVLAEKAKRSPAELSADDYRAIGFWFSVVNFDPDFLRGPVKVAPSVAVDLSDLVRETDDGTYVATRPPTDDDCNRLVAETAKVVAAVIPVHRKVMYNPKKNSGQVELVTTPFYHPILPLLCDSGIAGVAQPDDPLPSRFSYPEDAHAQVDMAIRYFRKIFRGIPSGMWPAEGAVAENTIGIYSRHGIKWIATDEKILARSKTAGPLRRTPYLATAIDDTNHHVAMVFRDTELSDRIGFTYKEMRPEDSVRDFIGQVCSLAPAENEPDCLLTVILDGENAWEWYRYDHNGKRFLGGLYRALTEEQEKGRIVTVTPSEYIDGNPKRHVAAHPAEGFPMLQSLWPGSWINASFDTWIGEAEENMAWEYLRLARGDLGSSGVHYPGTGAPMPRKGSKKWYALKAWEEMFAAEGSDWFWWYGADQTSSRDDTSREDDSPFDQGFITHCTTIYSLAKKAGGSMPQRKFTPIAAPRTRKKTGTTGTMARNKREKVRVVFQCDTRGTAVPSAIFITGNIPQLGNWMPNSVRMYDDGSHGDVTPGDGIWTFAVDVPSGVEIQYKFTNSGVEGEWEPGEEFPGKHRSVLLVRPPDDAPVVLLDRFGTI